MYQNKYKKTIDKFDFRTKMNINSKFKCREQDITFCETLIQRTAGWCKTGKRMESSHLGAAGANQ